MAKSIYLEGLNELMPNSVQIGGRSVVRDMDWSILGGSEAIV